MFLPGWSALPDLPYGDSAVPEYDKIPTLPNTPRVYSQFFGQSMICQKLPLLYSFQH